MPVDVNPPPEVAELADEVRSFVQEVVIPAESRVGDHGPTDELREELQGAARAAGLLAPHVGEAFGGKGLDIRAQTFVFEQAGYSLLGPLALNCAAPDEGNMHLLEKVATDAQKERFLAPLAAGRTRSCFAMTEPSPGAGSDPSMLRTTATRVDDGWRIDGEKWFITGADGAGFAICMARTGDSADSATMFLLDMDTPGVEVVRRVGSLDHGFVGGHCEVRFDGCVVGDDAVLGEVGRGFAYAQVRLGPARLTHCMRWLGIACRARDIAIDRAIEREAFGSRLAELGMVQAMIADNEIDIEASRSLILSTACALDAGSRGSRETSIAKTFVAEAVGRVVDRAVQICGSLGVSEDLPLGQFVREVRPFRIYDGPSETHRWSLARRAVRDRERARDQERTR